VGIHNLMEDAATAEISRSQIWQWVHNDVVLDNGETVTPELVRTVAGDVVAAIRDEIGEKAFQASRYGRARALFEQVALDDDFVEFLTLPGYESID
jgi:malate synthase